MLSHIQERLQKVLVLDGGVSSEISQAHPEIDVCMLSIKVYVIN